MDEYGQDEYREYQNRVHEHGHRQDRDGQVQDRRDEDRQDGHHVGRHRGWRPMSVWRSIGIAAAIAAVVVGLGFVGYVAIIAMAFSAWGSNK